MKSRVFYGWYVLTVAALAMVGTLPGRTQGLGLVTEPLLADLGLDRVTYATLNFWATIIGAAGALGVGRLIDRLGTRAVLTVVALTLGIVVCAMSQVTGVAALAVAMTLTRGLGQSALSVVSIAMVGHWFVRRINAAMAVYSLALSIGFMVAFPIVGTFVQSRGWRATWLAIGIALLAVLAPIAWLVVRRSPEAIGLGPDGEANRVAVDRAVAPEPAGHRWSEAVSTGAFWVFALGAALYGLVASGIGLFNESILAERGFAPDVYYTALAVTAITGLAGNFVAGAWADRGSLRRVLIVALLLLTVALIALPHVSTTAHVMAQAVAMGVAGGFVMVVFFSFWGKAYGRAHLGRIQGVAQALTVFASAVGPLLLAWCAAATGSYAAAFYVLAATLVLLTVAALVVRVPAGVEAAA